MSNLQNLLAGFDEWRAKIDEIGELGLPEEDFYVHLQKEVVELVEGRNNDEMRDVINTVFMLYVVGGYDVNFGDCYAKLKAREEKYEQRREHP